MSITRGVLAQSPEPEAPDLNTAVQNLLSFPINDIYMRYSLITFRIQRNLTIPLHDSLQVVLVCCPV